MFFVVCSALRFYRGSLGWRHSLRSCPPRNLVASTAGERKPLASNNSFVPFQLDEFLRLRPFAYHVTHRNNVDLLRSSGRIRTAASVIRDSGALHLLSLRRQNDMVVRGADGAVVLKDQHPLIAANLELPSDWSMAEFVAYLNGFVYFWPGTDRVPVGAGQRLLAHYEAEGPGVLRCPTADLIRANPEVPPEFCPFNSGAPRYHSGKRAFRGPSLFTDAAHFPRRASDVVELAFRGDIVLPNTTLIRSESGWANLFLVAG